MRISGWSSDVCSSVLRWLPTGVEIVPTYDRSWWIGAAVSNLWTKVFEEFPVVTLVCVLFLWHLRSALVAVITLPLGVLVAFIALHLQGVTANLMSLGGIAQIGRAHV